MILQGINSQIILISSAMHNDRTYIAYNWVHWAFPSVGALLTNICSRYNNVEILDPLRMADGKEKKQPGLLANFRLLLLYFLLCKQPLEVFKWQQLVDPNIDSFMVIPTRNVCK